MKKGDKVKHIPTGDILKVKKIYGSIVVCDTDKLEYYPNGKFYESIIYKAIELRVLK